MHQTNQSGGNLLAEINRRNTMEINQSNFNSLRRELLVLQREPMYPDQIAEAQKLAREWMEKHGKK